MMHKKATPFGMFSRGIYGFIFGLYKQKRQSLDSNIIQVFSFDGCARILLQPRLHRYDLQFPPVDEFDCIGCILLQCLLRSNRIQPLCDEFARLGYDAPLPSRALSLSPYLRKDAYRMTSSAKLETQQLNLRTKIKN